MLLKYSMNIVLPYYFFGFVQELVRDGSRFPTTGLDNPSTVSSILLQQPGKLKAKQIREGGWLDVI